MPEKLEKLIDVPENPVDISISPEKVYYIVDKAHEFDVKVAPVGTASRLDPSDDPGSNPADQGQVEILEDYADDPTGLELRSAIEILNEDEKLDLIALA